MKTKVFIVFFVAISIFLSSTIHGVGAAFDCLALSSSSREADKDYCRKELTQIEAELTRLLDLQKQQQKQTGALLGDVNYLTSQINALKAKIKARSLVDRKSTR